MAAFQRMKSLATTRFWMMYHELPPTIRRLAVKTYKLWQNDPRHPSIAFKKLKGQGTRFSVRIGDHYRAIGHLITGGVEWVWIGHHKDYDTLLRS